MNEQTPQTEQQVYKQETPIQVPQSEPWWVIIGIAFISIINFLGAWIISNKVVNFIQKMFEEHLEVHNYIIKNSGTKEFWKENFIYSGLLSVALFIKGLFFTSYIRVDVLIGITCISYLMMKFHESKGSIKLNTIVKNNYNDTEVNKEDEIKEEVTKPKPVLSESPKPPPIPEPEIKEVDITQPKEKKKLTEEEAEGVLKRIGEGFKEAVDKREMSVLNPPKEYIEEIIKSTNPGMLINRTVDNITRSIGERDNIGDTIEPLKDMEMTMGGMNNNGLDKIDPNVILNRLKSLEGII